MVGKNGDTSGRNGQGDTLVMAVVPGNGQPTDQGHHGEDGAISIAGRTQHGERRSQRKRSQRGDTCKACRVDPGLHAKSGTNGSALKTAAAAESASRGLPSPNVEEFVWDENRYAMDNFAALGERLARTGDLFRNSADGGGLLLLLPDGRQRAIARAQDLAAIIADRVRLRRRKDGNDKGDSIPTAHLNAMLQSNAFLGKFAPLDHVTRTPLYLPGFALTKPGYNDGGDGYRVFYAGPEPEVAGPPDMIGRFLDTMDWESNADRTNAVAAALTVMLRNHFPGGKPIILATASKSHAGKDTVLDFAAGQAGSVSISYQGTNWALERSFVGAIKTAPDAGVVVIENARLGPRDKFIASAFIERFVTDPEPLLFSTGTGAPVRRRNDFVLGISTNFGTVSEDALNRSLPLRLHLIGDVADRKSPIGNPRYEFLPANKERIAAELRGMIERWKEAGQPLDEEVRHPFSQWAKTIGGILKVNGFTDFLANYGVRKTSDDPIRKAVGLLGAYEFRSGSAGSAGEWRRAGEWAEIVSTLGLVRTLVAERDRENDDSRARAMGVVLSTYEQETFTAEDESRLLTLRLEKSRHRRNNEEAKVYYRFVLVGEEALPENGAPGTSAAGHFQSDHE